MKNINKVRFNPSTLILITIIVLSLHFLPGCQKKNALSFDQPFLITVSNPEIQEEDGVKYLFLSVEIMNKTENDYHDVHYTLSLNKEITPFIGSQIIDFKSDQFTVTTPERASANKLPTLLVIGFKHNWSMAITEESDLKEYTNYNLEQLTENLKTVTVLVEWNNGKQEYVQNVSILN